MNLADQISGVAKSLRLSWRRYKQWRDVKREWRASGIGDVTDLLTLIRKTIADDAHQSALHKEFLHAFEQFAAASSATNREMTVDWGDRYPCFGDSVAVTGFDRHYIYHPAWAARIIKRINPALHIDVSSTLHFCTLISAFVKTEFYDYRPADIRLPNMACGRADLTALPFPDRSIESLSCMHVLEHIGLGRYGDPLDPEGDLRAMSELKRVLAPGGSLLVVVPLGRRRVMFNAHRVYDRDSLQQAFADLELVDFTLIPESGIDGGLVSSPSRELLERQEYGCGCFWFKRP